MGWGEGEGRGALGPLGWGVGARRAPWGGVGGGVARFARTDNETEATKQGVRIPDARKP